jgi:hypothetical protein
VESSLSKDDSTLIKVAGSARKRFGMRKIRVFNFIKDEATLDKAVTTLIKDETTSDKAVTTLIKDDLSFAIRLSKPDDDWMALTGFTMMSDEAPTKSTRLPTS